MFYKLFEYSIERDDVLIEPDRHLRMFHSAKGHDENGHLAIYRGQQNAVLMHVRAHRELFTGLIGKHSTEREITKYDDDSDVTRNSLERDDNYPHTPFICIPKIKMIACVDSSLISAQAAMARLHAILAHRARAFFVVRPVRQVDDLRFAARNFRLTEVDYEILPVNPHTKDLGRQLDESRMRDHIQRLKGKAIGSEARPLRLGGGFLSSVQELQESGHSRVGYTGVTGDGIEIKVPKPKEARELPRARPEDQPTEETPAVRVRFKGEPVVYPFSRDHLERVVTVMRIFSRTIRRQSE